MVHKREYNRPRYQKAKLLWKFLFLRLDHEMHDELKTLSRNSKKPMATLIREFIEEGLENERLSAAKARTNPHYQPPRGLDHGRRE